MVDPEDGLLRALLHLLDHPLPRIRSLAPLEVRVGVESSDDRDLPVAQFLDRLPAQEGRVEEVELLGAPLVQYLLYRFGVVRRVRFDGFDDACVWSPISVLVLSNRSRRRCTKKLARASAF